MPATQSQLRIIRRFAVAGMVGGLVWAVIAIIMAFSKNAVTGAVLAVALPIYLFLPVGIGAIAGCLLGWVVCLVLRKK